MIRVKLSVELDNPMLRQTPNRAGIWGNVNFVTDPKDEGLFDFWIVPENLRSTTSATVKSGGVLFVTWEPPAIRNYSSEFLRQFDAVLTFRTDIAHPKIFRTHPLLPWWIGTSGGHTFKVVERDFDSFNLGTTRNCEAKVSVVCSNKVTTDGHRKRLELVKGLQKILGDRMEVFGPGFREWPTAWPDKWDSIAPFQYHLAIENSCHQDYWTEKVADAFLGGAFLFYWGCPNLSDFFPRGAFQAIDINDVQQTANLISESINSGLYESAKADIAEARNLVLNKYNFFDEVARLVTGFPTGEPQIYRLRPENEFQVLPIRSKIKLLAKKLRPKLSDT